MKIDNATAALQAQINKVGKQTIFHDNNWNIQTLSLLEEIFGDNSVEILNFKNAKIRLKYRGALTPDDHKFDDIECANSVSVAKKYLQDCIDTLQVKGVYQKPKSNWLSKMAAEHLIALLSFVLGLIVALCSAAYFLGVQNEKVRNTEVRQNHSIPSQLK